MHQCNQCKKILETDDRIYVDGYFGQIHCSWECLVEMMAEFFEVEQYRTIALSEYLKQ